jgi:hypothetical protein
MKIEFSDFFGPLTFLKTWAANLRDMTQYLTKNVDKIGQKGWPKNFKKKIMKILNIEKNIKKIVGIL